MLENTTSAQPYQLFITRTKPWIRYNVIVKFWFLSQ